MAAEILTQSLDSNSGDFKKITKYHEIHNETERAGDTAFHASQHFKRLTQDATPLRFGLSDPPRQRSRQAKLEWHGKPMH